MKANQYTSEELKDQWRNNRENKKYPKANGNTENASTQKLQNARRPLLRGKLLAIQA